MCRWCVLRQQRPNKTSSCRLQMHTGQSFIQTPAGSETGFLVLNVPESSCNILLPPAAILDDQSVCGRGERLALALARENINSLMEGLSQARVEVDVYELQKDSQYDTTDTSKCLTGDTALRPELQLLTFFVLLSLLPSVSDPAKGRGLCDWPCLQPRLRVHHQSHLWGERGKNWQRRISILSRSHVSMQSYVHLWKLRMEVKSLAC